MTENPDEFELEDEALELASGGYSLPVSNRTPPGYPSLPSPSLPSPSLPTDPGFTSIIS